MPPPKTKRDRENGITRPSWADIIATGSKGKDEIEERESGTTIAVMNAERSEGVERLGNATGARTLNLNTLPPRSEVEPTAVTTQQSETPGVGQNEEENRIEEREGMAKECTKVDADMRDACEGMAARQRLVTQEICGTTNHPTQREDRRREEKADLYDVDAKGSDYM